MIRESEWVGWRTFAASTSCFCWTLVALYIFAFSCAAQYLAASFFIAEI
jgi:hypothetical protein